MLDEQPEWVILGITTKGEAFDAPNWNEQLCGILASKSGGRLTYSDYLEPNTIDSLPAVVVLGRLKEDHPAVYEQVNRFVAENQLKTRAGRTSSIENTTTHPTLNIERRNYFRG